MPEGVEGYPSQPRILGYFGNTDRFVELNEHQRVIYEILEKRVKMPSGMLYKKYCGLVSKPVVARAYRNYMKKMVNLGLVNSKGNGRWKTYEMNISAQ